MLKPLLLSLFSLLCLACRADNINRTTVDNLDLERYLGRWHEIARFDTHFERDLVKVTAEYTLSDDGSIEVINRGYNTRKGRWGEASGRVKRTNKPGRLKVSFVPMVYSDYNVLAVGENYEWALVGSSSPDHLWILARSEDIPAQTLDSIISLARARGYDTTKLNIL